MSILLLGEVWGVEEEREGKAFVGASGWELKKMLKEAGIRWEDCEATNVFNMRAKVENLCGTKTEGIFGYPAISKAGYIRKEFRGELERLADEIDFVNPNLILALGNTASWAMLGKTTMKNLRGTVQMSTHTVTGYKVLPTYNPAAVFKQWSIRPVTVMDFIKAKREAQFPDIQLPQRHIWIEPSLEDIYEFDRTYLRQCEATAVDIETSGNIITCIGFSPRKDLAIVIPGIGIRRSGRPYWPSLDVERKVFKIIKDILTRPIPKIFQNGLYDIAFIYRAWKIGVINAEHDTMLLHHAMYPEALKSLGFLGSVYTNEGAWKGMREKKTTIKRDD